MTSAPSVSAPDHRRGLATAVIVCAAGAGLVLWAVTRVWSYTPAVRPAPLPPTSAPHTGSSHLGWVVAVALVALAGAGALLATRGGVRAGLGGLLALVGVIMLLGGADGLRLVAGARFAWPVLMMAGGAAVAWSGVDAARHGSRWPAMGARYDKPAGHRAADRPRTDASMWDDLDRGVDPTTTPRD